MRPVTPETFMTHVTPSQVLNKMLLNKTWPIKNKSIIGTRHSPRKNQSSKNIVAQIKQLTPELSVKTPIQAQNEDLPIKTQLIKNASTCRNTIQLKRKFQGAWPTKMLPANNTSPPTAVMPKRRTMLMPRNLINDVSKPYINPSRNNYSSVPAQPPEETPTKESNT
jgi:hypothetical protein